MTQSPDAKTLAEIAAHHDEDNAAGPQFILKFDRCNADRATLLALVARLMETQRTPGTVEVCEKCGAHPPIENMAYCKRRYEDNPGCLLVRPATPRAGEG